MKYVDGTKSETKCQQSEMMWDERFRDILANLRIVPRVMVLLYGIAFWRVILWFMGLDDPTMAQATFVSTITGAGAAFFGLYVGSGNK